MLTSYVCEVCGHIEFNLAPEFCPVCTAPKEKFRQDPAAIMPAEKEGKEKHVPVIVATSACGLIPGECRDVHVKIGSVPHPMLPEHWIQWIDLYLNENFIARYQLTAPTLQAAVGVHLKAGQSGTFRAVGHCNIHGTWMAETEI